MLPTRELALASIDDPWPTLQLASDLESGGVDSLWIGESVVARPRIDAYALLSALAATTSGVTLGTAVLLPSLRNPVSFAHQIASIDRIAKGRLIIGTGAGFPGPDTQAEFAALGADYANRTRGIEATLDAARQLWSAASTGDSTLDPTGADGRNTVAITPPPTRTSGPKTWLATGTPSGRRRCGEHHDGWLPYPPEPTDYRDGLADVRAAAEAAERDPASIEEGLYITVAIGDGDEPQRQLDDYCNAYYGGPSELVGLVQALVPGNLDQVADRLSEYVDAGARHLVIRHACLDPTDVLAKATELHDVLRARHQRR